MGIAGLWGSNRKATGEEVFSFTMLTINADDHEFFKNFHKPQDEKRMVVILQEDQQEGWPNALTGQSPDLMRQFPEQLLIATAPHLGTLSPTRNATQVLASRSSIRRCSASMSGSPT